MVTARQRGARLEVRGLTKTYPGIGERPLLTLDRIELVALPGEFIALIGPSGAGKSTLFQILAGLEGADEGEILIDGAVLPNRLGACAFMPQRDALLPWRRTIDNVTIGLEVAGESRAAARERARPLLERFGLAGFEHAWPWQLSGGMRQRAAFLRTVLLGRPAMLLDEPFGALDGITRAELQQWLLEVWSEFGSTVALITHDVAEAVFLADRVYVMSPAPGRIDRVIDIDLPRPRTLALEESPEFAAHEASLREALRAGRRPGARRIQQPALAAPAESRSADA
jgi:ABC-type nitrate/sulfonate/bicarbonate transport system ATPase subunit